MSTKHTRLHKRHLVSYTARSSDYKHIQANATDNSSNQPTCHNNDGGSALHWLCHQRSIVTCVDAHACFHLITIEDSSLHMLFQQIFNTCTVIIIPQKDWWKCLLLEMKDFTSDIKIEVYLKTISVLPTVILNNSVRGIHSRRGYFNVICGGDYLFSHYISDMRS